MDRSVRSPTSLPLAFTALLLTSASAGALAEAAAPVGQGKTPCSEFNTLVDGNWSHPLNALNFHGYVSWGLGAVSGYNAWSGKPALATNSEELKQFLVDYCQANAGAPFAEAVDAFIAAREAR